MKINIQPIVKTVALRDYDARMEGAEVMVWVNPPQSFLSARDVMMRGLLQQKAESEEPTLESGMREAEGARYRTFNAGMMAWYSKLWSQGEDPELYWTVQEIEELAKADPACFNWIVRETARLMKEHRTGEKKS